MTGDLIFGAHANINYFQSSFRTVSTSQHLPQITGWLKLHWALKTQVTRLSGRETANINFKTFKLKVSVKGNHSLKTEKIRKIYQAFNTAART
jgi:hypothetical protein